MKHQETIKAPHCDGMLLGCPFLSVGCCAKLGNPQALDCDENHKPLRSPECLKEWPGPIVVTVEVQP